MSSTLTSPAVAAALRKVDEANRALVAAITAELAQQAPASNALLDVNAAARRLGISRSDLYLRLSRGDIRSHKVGRRRLISEAAIAEFMAQHEA